MPNLTFSGTGNSKPGLATLPNPVRRTVDFRQSCQKSKRSLLTILSKAIALEGTFRQHCQNVHSKPFGSIAKRLPPAGGIGVRGFPLQVRKMYICAMLAPTPPRGRCRPRPRRWRGFAPSGRLIGTGGRRPLSRRENHHRSRWRRGCRSFRS